MCEEQRGRGLLDVPHARAVLPRVHLVGLVRVLLQARVLGAQAPLHERETLRLLRLAHADDSKENPRNLSCESQ